MPYSTLEKSPLGQLLSSLQSKLSGIQKARSTPKKVSIEKAYADQQLTAITQLFDILKNVLSYYSEGKVPSTWALSRMIPSVLGLRVLLPAFQPPGYIIYNAMKTDLEAVVAAAFFGLGTPLSEESLQIFKERLKTGIRNSKNKHFALAKKVLGIDLESMLTEIDQIIENIENHDPLIRYSKAKKIDKMIKSVEGTLDFSMKLFTVGMGDDYQLKIVDPGLYQLIIECLLLLDTAPQSLDNLISFLNPGALDLDLQSGVVAKILSAAGCELFKLAHSVVVDTENPTAYCYELSTRDGSTVFNGDKLYRESQPVIRDFLGDALRAYFTDYADTPHVRSERAKAAFIKKFVTEEHKWLQSGLLICKEKSELLFKSEASSAMSHENKLNFLTQQIGLSDVLLKEAEQLITVTRERNYEQLHVGDLLNVHEQLKGKLATDLAQGFDTSYIDASLPPTLIGENSAGNFTAISILADLQAARDLAIDELSKSKQAVNKQRELFSKQYEETLQSWHQEEIKKHSKENELWLERLEKFSEEASKALHIDDSMGNEQQIQLISRQLDALKEQQAALKSYELQIQKWQRELDNPIECPAQLRQADTTIVEKAMGCYALSKEKMAACINQLRVSAQSLECRQIVLESQLRKAEVAKVFAETMSSSDPQVIEKLVSDKEAQLERLGVECCELEARVKSKQAQLQQSENLPDLDLLKQLVNKQERFIEETLRLIASTDQQMLVITTAKSSAYFTQAKLQSVDGINAATDWLQRLIKKQTSLMAATDHNDYAKRIKALEAVYACLTSKNKVTFSTLDALPALQGIFVEKGKKGFDVLLAFLDDPDTTVIWQIFRQSTPDKPRFLAERSRLLDLIQAKIVAYQHKQKAVEVLQQAQKDFSLVKDSLDSVSDLMTFLQALNESIERLKEQHKAFVEQHDKLLVSIGREQGVLAEKEAAISLLSKETGILKQIVDLLKGCQALNQLVAEVESSASPLDVLDTATAKLNELRGSLALLNKNLVCLPDPTVYSVNSKTIESSLQISAQMMLSHREAIFSKEELTALDVQITASTKTIATMADTLVQLEQEGDLVGKLQGLSTLLEQYKGDFARRSPLVVAHAGLAHTDLLATGSDHVRDQFNLVRKNAGHLKSNSKQILAGSLKQIEMVVQCYADVLQAHAREIATLSFDETEQTYLNNQRSLVKVAGYLDVFPIIQFASLQATLKKLEPASKNLLEKFNGTLQAYGSLQTLLGGKQTINNKLKTRIELRTQLTDQFKAALDEYIKKRNKKYAVKDKLLWGDGAAREKFVTQLKLKLEAYADCGDSKPVVDCITEGKQFAGYTLQSVLNGLLNGLDEQDNQIPTDYNNVESEVVVISHEQALALLAVAGQNQAFVTSIHQLYAKIDLMGQHGVALGGQHGEVASKLAARLRTKVDGFVITHQGDQLNQAAVQSFQTTFIYLLHSKDDVMSQHASWWMPLLANMVILVATLGIAIGIKAASSKLRTGRFALFCDRSSGLEELDAVDRAVTSIAAPAA